MEKEIRAVKYSYEPNLDEKSFLVPRLYVEVDKNVFMNRVIIGPRVDKILKEKLKYWLNTTNKVTNVEESKCNYQ
ncbi:MAG: hypothetical protein LUC97_09835 [Clostridiales bacterium]|nr:hypothetical protein [Clostridiales bacterium]